MGSNGPSNGAIAVGMLVVGAAIAGSTDTVGPTRAEDGSFVDTRSAWRICKEKNFGDGEICDGLSREAGSVSNPSSQAQAAQDNSTPAQSNETFSSELPSVPDPVVTEDGVFVTSEFIAAVNALRDKGWSLPALPVAIIPGPKSETIGDIGQIESLGVAVSRAQLDAIISVVEQAKNANWRDANGVYPSDTRLYLAVIQTEAIELMACRRETELAFPGMEPGSIGASIRCAI